jgi:hypothetical protein
MKKIMTLIIAGAIAVFTASSVFAAQDDHRQMSGMNMKKNTGKSMKKKGATAKKKGMTMKKKSTTTKKKPAKKKSGMGNMKMDDM